MSGPRDAQRRHQQVSAAVLAAHPGVTPAQIQAALTAVASHPAALCSLAAALRADPDALRIGAPPVVGALVTALRAHGAASLPAPSCAACAREGLPLTRSLLVPGFAPAADAVSSRRPASAAGSSSRSPAATMNMGRSARAARTGRNGPADAAGGSGGSPGAPTAEPDVCDLCFRMPSADCSLCGRHRPCAFASTAAPVCAGCALRRVIACARCGKLAPPTANWPEGPVCDPCYNAALRRRGTCAGCQANRRLVAPPGPDANLCAPTLLVPTLGRTTGPAIDGDQRWTLLARLLHDHDVDLTDRVAGSLLLSYGQQLSRIAVMTTDQIHHHADSVSVRFGSCDITVPEPLAGLLTELIDTGRRYRGVGSPATPSRWLFPGHLPGRPITPARLGERLRAVGLRALPGRRATQLQLASEVPAAVLADLLHLSPGTATRWTRDVGGDWSRYAASIALARGHGG